MCNILVLRLPNKWIFVLDVSFLSPNTISRQRIQNLLKGTVTEDNKSADIEGVRDLSDKLTADKIAALKNKRKKNMARNTIKSVDDR